MCGNGSKIISEDKKELINPRGHDNGAKEGGDFLMFGEVEGLGEWGAVKFDLLIQL